MGHHHLANPVLLPLRYPGRRTGQVHEPQSVDVWLAGQHLTSTARDVHEDADSDQFRAALAAYRAVFPKVPNASVMVGVQLGQSPTAQASR